MAKANNKLIQEAKDRFKKCEDHEAQTRPLFLEDLKFANADPDNGYQWPHDLKKARELDKRPCLTINKVKQHNRQITNDARQNKPSVRVQPVDNGADKKTAEILNGIIRHIEANSSADTAYDTAAEFAVDAGIGYWRIVTDYCDENSFDQDIFIKRVKNPLNVYLDPNIQEADGSDARFGFVFEDIAKEEFERRWPDADPVNWNSTGDSWITKDTIRIAEYFKIVEEKDTLIADEQGNTILLSKIEDPALAKAAKNDPNLRKRPVTTKKGKWFLLAGDQVLEEKDWLGKYIPIVRVVGEEIEIEGKVDRKGHTRGMKDAQRMYNFWTSSATEHVALQGKQPYLAPAEAIAGYEQYWNNLNTGNQPYLPYNSVDDAGNQIPMPQRQQPPVMAPAYMQGMQVASEEMKMASGQYDASMGAKSNETSGRAIMARQREGDVATFHFIDNVARAIKYTGKILVDLIPKIYDTPRVVRILGEDGKEDIVKLDPGIQKPVEEQRSANGDIEEIYNPGVGRYDVTVTVGPSYSTKRQEAAANMVEMARGNPNMWQTHGDLIVKSQDWPMADEFAKRSEKLLPPELRDDEEGKPQIPPEAQQKMQQMEQALQNAMTEVEELEAKASEVDIKRVEANTRAYDAITKRLQVLGPLLDAVQVQQLAAETQREAMEQLDPGMAPAESMGIPEMPEELPPDPMMEEQPQAADAAFFTPEELPQQPY